MSYFYTDSTRETETYAVPDGEVFYARQGEWGWTRDGERADYDAETAEDLGIEPNAAGYYWWSCFPGCLPDSDPSGPFETEEEAIEAARALSCD